MRALAAMAVTALLAYSLGRAVEWRAWQAACEAPTPEPDDYAVQPPDRGRAAPAHPRRPRLAVRGHAVAPPRRNVK